MVWWKDLAGSAGGAGLWGSVVTSGSSVYFGTGNQYATTGTPGDSYSIVSMNAQTGAQLWRFRIYRNHTSGGDYDFGSTPNLFSDHTGKRLEVGLGNKNGYYYIVNARTGSLIRKVLVKQDGGVIGLGAVIPGPDGGSEVIVPTFHNGDYPNEPCCGGLTALDPRNGEIYWTSTALGSVGGSVAAVPGAVLFGDDGGNLFAVATTDGTQLFHTQLPSPIGAGISVAEGHVFVPTGLPFDSNDKGAYGVYSFAP